jgi:hypothetical protein
MARNRLTASTKIGEDNSTPFPGTVGNEGRPATPREKYDTFVEQPGFITQQPGAPWKEDSRDEIGFGVPKAAAMFATAHKATRLAIMFLGDKVTPTVIEAQARDFMRLGSTRIDAALKRFADSESVYTTAADCKEDVAPKEEEKKDAACGDKKDEEKKDAAAPAPVAATPAPTAIPAPAPTAEVKPVEAAPVVATPAPAATPVPAPVAEAKPVEAAPVAAPVATPVPTPTATPAPAPTAEVAVAAGEEDVVLAEPMDENALDIQLFSEPEVPVDMTPEDEADVGALFDVDDPMLAASTASAAKPPKKAGVKTLGGQPSIPQQTRVASELDELAGLWKDAPDVSDVFGSTSNE